MSLSVITPVDPNPPNPPRRRTSPDWSFQQRWDLLTSIKVTDKAVNVPAPSNREQDFSCLYPPQARLPQTFKPQVATGMSPILQLRPDLGLKIFAVLNGLPPYPPTVRIPACKHFSVISSKYDVIVLPSVVEGEEGELFFSILKVSIPSWMRNTKRGIFGSNGTKKTEEPCKSEKR